MKLTQRHEPAEDITVIKSSFGRTMVITMVSGEKIWIPLSFEEAERLSEELF
jgi:hypothetical protein